MKLLIADDDRVFCQLLTTTMLSHRWSVEIASDAMQTIMFAKRGHPDVIVLDIQMPGGTGIEALKKLKANARTRDIPVIVITGSTDETVHATVLGLGATRFIRKPVDMEALEQELSELRAGHVSTGAVVQK